MRSQKKSGSFRRKVLTANASEAASAIEAVSDSSRGEGKDLVLPSQQEHRRASNAPAAVTQAGHQDVQYLHSAPRLWRIAFKTLLIRSQLVAQFQAAISTVESILSTSQKHVDPEPDKEDVSFSEKVKALIRTRGASKTSTSITAMEVLLTSRLTSFRRFSLPQRLKFCELLQIECHPPGKIIILEGHVSTSFYFVLTGKVEIFKGCGDEKILINMLGKGSSFGDRTMSVLNDKRTATVATVETTEILQIDKRDFMSIAESGSSKELAARAEQLRQLPDFASATKEFLESMLTYSQFVTIESQQTLSTQDTRVLQMFWVLSGSCRCVRTVPFLRRHAAQLDGQQVVPYSTDLPIEPGDEVFSENLNICELSIGDHFPGLRLPSRCQLVRSPRGNVISLDRKECIRAWAEDPNNVSPVTVLTNTKVDIMIISQSEFLEMAPLDVLVVMFAQRTALDVPVRSLQMAYLQKRQWEHYKKKVTGEVLGRRKK
ncbi:hypothetical protein HK105_207589 [Polyrhizophydium stewartii]|uniref:Cyclic nucleotide-binding domain-containing protein n=1 Tax=Polyrhizophydium stewartii TaxID=2732419 RepID=A0ABR4N0C1_9FUNG